MRVIKYKTLEEFWLSHRDCENALKSWFQEMKNNDFPTPVAIKNMYTSADILPNDRVVFNIKGNHYRLIVKIQYNAKIVYIRFIGTHKEYDRIDARKI